MDYNLRDEDDTRSRAWKGIRWIGSVGSGLEDILVTTYGTKIVEERTGEKAEPTEPR
jgi:hypothetical protein